MTITTFQLYFTPFQQMAAFDDITDNAMPSFAI